MRKAAAACAWRPDVAASQDFIEEFPENDRSRFGLPLGGVLVTVQNNQADNPAPGTVKRAHDRYGNFTGFISAAEWHDDRCHVIKQSLWPDTKHMAEKNDFHVLPIDPSLDKGRQSVASRHLRTTLPRQSTPQKHAGFMIASDRRMITRAKVGPSPLQIIANIGPPPFGKSRL